MLEDKEPVILCLFHGINWLREMVNAFANIQESEIRGNDNE